MALYRLILSRIFNRINRPTIYLQKNLKQSTPSEDCTNIDFENAIDNFTIELLQKKKESWEIKNEKFKSVKLPLKNNHTNSNSVVENLTVLQLEEKFNSALVECNDASVLELLKECLRLKRCPSQDLLLQILTVCAQNGEIDLVNELDELCSSMKISLPSNFNFIVFKAHATWTKGLVIKGLDMFHEIYVKNPFLRRYIRMILKHLIPQEVKNNSEAVLIYMLKIAKDIANCYKDYFFLICLWESCFFSDSYSDQQFAFNLLFEYVKLNEAIASRLPFLMSIKFRNHKTESVYKLLECFHVLDMKEQRVIVTMGLLDYHFIRGNIGNYSEIIKWCEKCQILLPEIYKEKFLKLILKLEGFNIEQKLTTRVRNKPPDLKF